MEKRLLRPIDTSESANCASTPTDPERGHFLERAAPLSLERELLLLSGPVSDEYRVHELSVTAIKNLQFTIDDRPFFPPATYAQTGDSCYAFHILPDSIENEIPYFWVTNFAAFSDRFASNRFTGIREDDQPFVREFFV